jgi:hypothetical protein
VRNEKQSLRNRATPPHIKRNIRVFFECLTQFKEIISTTVFSEILATPYVLDEIEAFGPEFSEALYILAPVLTAASLGREKFNQNLWYDIKSHPERHLRTSYELASLCDHLGYRIFETFPLRATYIPCFVPLDIGVVMSHILELPRNEQTKWRKDPCVFWDQVFNLNQRAFMQNNQIFTGWFRTDGVSLHITRSATGEMTSGGARKRKRGASAEEKHDATFRCLENIPREELLKLTGKCVLVDPNRRDILYAMHELSTPEDPIIFRYTTMGRRYRTAAKHHRQIRLQEEAGDINVINALVALSTTRRKSVSRVDFNEYLTTKRVNRPTLDTFYSRHVFRQLRYDRHIKYQRERDYLTNELRRKFASPMLNDGESPTIIIGITKITNTQFHAPTPGVMMRWLLHKKGFNVILIDEYLTSSRCPLCHNPVQKFRERPSPRPWRKNLPPSLVHGIVKCQSEECRLALGGKDRVWNRDLLATLNFRRILEGYRNGSGRPTDLSRM